MSQKQAMLWARVDINIKEIVHKLVDCKGITISEYVRSLVIDDLDRRNVFTTKLKEELR